MLSLIQNDVKIILKEVPETVRITLPDSTVVENAQEGRINEEFSLMKILPADPIPEGMTAAFVDVQMVDGFPKYVNTLEPLPPTSHDDVNQEADRRIQSGFVYGGKLFDYDLKAQRRIGGASTKAFLAIANGAQAGDLYWHLSADEKADPTTNIPFAWICNDNSTMVLDAQSMIELGNAAFSWESAHVKSAFAVKRTNPIPMNYKDDVFWP